MNEQKEKEKEIGFSHINNNNNNHYGCRYSENETVHNSNNNRVSYNLLKLDKKSGAKGYKCCLINLVFNA
ncbi:hypothetical protein DERF_004931 [Dermatophagoides farinae]|uniref:Uncharacterized protein n=1 Tax=Dermatophagoides farinae TaxID=6954 RepID=A0A922L6N5_DERFA|nr:hypothetical protein DERF_004931 [Dermatophagoides farinae]